MINFDILWTVKYSYIYLTIYFINYYNLSKYGKFIGKIIRLSVKIKLITIFNWKLIGRSYKCDLYTKSRINNFFEKLKKLNSKFLV